MRRSAGRVTRRGAYRVEWASPRWPGGGFRVDALTRADLFAAVAAAVATRESMSLVSANLQWLALRRRPDIRALDDRFTYALVDGTPLRWFLRGAVAEDVEKLSGSDLILEFCAESARTGTKLYFLGASPEVAAAAAERAQILHPGCKIAGIDSPPPAVVDDPEASRALCEEINAASPDVLFVAFGMPRQEEWLARHADDLEVPVRFGIGASLDFLAGDVRRAPVMMQRLGLEWVWRLMLEPRRLWRRYIVECVPVGVAMLRELVAMRLPPRRR